MRTNVMILIEVLFFLGCFLFASAFLGWLVICWYAGISEVKRGDVVDEIPEVEPECKRIDVLAMNSEGRMEFVVGAPVKDDETLNK